MSCILFVCRIIYQSQWEYIRCDKILAFKKTIICYNLNLPIVLFCKVKIFLILTNHQSFHCLLIFCQDAKHERARSYAADSGLDVRYQRADAATSDINAGLYLQHMLADGMWFVHVSPFTLQENNGERGLLARMRRYLATRRRNLCQMPGDVARIKARVYF